MASDGVRGRGNERGKLGTLLPLRSCSIIHHSFVDEQKSHTSSQWDKGMKASGSIRFWKEL
ncbi:hypothetical protein BT69DRAFT_1280437 [Atractiella rhizophila]|nr:hypothetical protein BT69DRAFT_1280437 [Atractiella rhizophila]